MASTKNITDPISKFFSEKLKEYGATPKGVDWKDKQSQLLRFENLFFNLDLNKKFSITDVGCGYGGLYNYLKESNTSIEKYTGVDFSSSMIKVAKQSYETDNCLFSVSDQNSSIPNSDLVVASGIFNMMLKFSRDMWFDHVTRTLSSMFKSCNRCVCCNFITTKVDYEVDNLFYLAPDKILNYCLDNFSKKVVLIHNYPLYEYTIQIFK